MVKYDNSNDVRRWFIDGGDSRFRYDYPLNNNSVVFDVGGYEGSWAENINKKFKPNLYIFEPVKKYFDLIQTKFTNEDNVKVYNLGLSDSNKDLEINLLNDGSSIFIKSQNTETIKLVDIVTFMEENDINTIDLLKLNIEGSEYELLEHLIRKNKIKNIKNIQVQFHDFVDYAIDRRDRIREFLSKTHKETYCYNFVWENWTINN